MSEMDADGFGGSSFTGDGGFNDAGIGIDTGTIGSASAGFQDDGFGAYSAYSAGFNYDAIHEASLIAAQYGVQGLPVAGFAMGMFGYGYPTLNAIAGQMLGYPVGYTAGYTAEAGGQAMSLGINTSPDNYGLNWGGNDSP